jgi:hypothetical protein
MKTTMRIRTEKKKTTIVGREDLEISEILAEEEAPRSAAYFVNLITKHLTTTHKLLKVPRAYNWHPGMIIHDDKGKALFKVISERCVYCKGDPAPVYEAHLMDIETREEVAYIKAVVENFGETYHIYMACPPVSRYQSGPNFYEAGILRQSAFGKNYTYKRRVEGHHFSTAMKASNGRIRCSLFACMIPFICPRWNIKFYDIHHPENPVIIRDQRENTLSVAPGENLLEAVSISYAVDRLTNPCTHEVVGRAVTEGFRHC